MHYELDAVRIMEPNKLKENEMYNILVDNFVETTTTTVEHAQSLAQDYLEEFGYGADVKVVFEEEYA